MKNKVSEYSRTTALLLAFFFGLLAIHRFFLGYRRSAIAQFICTLVLIITLVGFLYNHPFLFRESFKEPVLVSTVLIDYRTFLMILMPLGLLQLWVWYDILRLLFGYFKDSNGRVVKIWIE
jgi:TM2 domain-containing membrane protein YozV